MANTEKCEEPNSISILYHPLPRRTFSDYISFLILALTVFSTRILLFSYFNSFLLYLHAPNHESLIDTRFDSVAFTSVRFPSDFQASRFGVA